MEGKEEASWDNLFFKSSKDFIAGCWTRNKENWRTLIAQMPENSKPLLYHFVMKGADLFLNLQHIPRQEAVTVKRTTIFTKWKKHESNKELLKLMGGNMKIYINGRLRLTKFVPRPYEITSQGRTRTLAIPNQESVRERADDVTQQLKLLKKGDLMVKFDDKRGFHQMPLAEESKKMACFEWGGKKFVNNILCFGLPAAPGIYQSMNLVGINFLRKNGIKATLYLDDRLVVITPKSEAHRLRLLEGKEVCKEAWVTAATLVALGGFVNIEKSEFIPKQRMEFLGFILDSETETIEIPQSRWLALKAKLQQALNSERTSLKELERIRGTQASMAEVFPNMRMLIRQITMLIGQAEIQGAYEVRLTRAVKAEWKTWLNFENSGLKRCWKQQDRQNAGIIIYTDASNHAGAIVVEEWNISEKFAWDEEYASDHICIKEAVAVKYALEWYAKRLENKKVTFLVDNSSVVEGAVSGSKDLKMNRILVRIWETALKFNMDLKLEWVSTTLQKADEPSRTIDTREQRLTEAGFAYLQAHLQEKLEVDVAATPLMQAQARSDFEIALHANISVPNHKKMLLNPADGSLDQRQNQYKGNQRGKGRRQSFQEEGQHKKAKYYDQGKGQNENAQKTGDRSGQRGGGKSSYRGGGRGRGGYKGQQNFAKGGQKDGQKNAFKDKGGVE
ncbi:unnamed protein product [Oikopleura dioica]|uniref:ribonuclease H n=1 Tax=Oikopleura dioica TaxID=34765 RepID=E4X2F4_OIKDI|nr:unnamed protein product [Oikopleura dioica]